MSFFVFIEPRNTLDGHIICLGSSRSENNVLGLCADEVRYMLECVTGVSFCTHKLNRFTLRATSTACSASHPYAWVRLCGLPYWSVRYGNIASRTRGSTGVVAWILSVHRTKVQSNGHTCMSRYIGRAFCVTLFSRLGTSSLKPSISATKRHERQVIIYIKNGAYQAEVRYVHLPCTKEGHQQHLRGRHQRAARSVCGRKRQPARWCF